MIKTHTIEYGEYEHYRELSERDQDLVAQAYKACADAYAPYSKFQVGAALELDNGNVVLGNNQENIAYPSGLCAERVALYYAGAVYKNEAIKTIVVVAKGDLVGQDDCLSPCGSCRQVIAESEMRQENRIRIVLVSQSGKTFVFNGISDLLVFPFGMQ